MPTWEEALKLLKIIDVSNPSTYDFSDDFNIMKAIELEPPKIPGYNFYFLISIICVVSIIEFFIRLLKKKNIM